MKYAQTNLEEEIATLDQHTAAQFKRTVLDMLQLLKQTQNRKKNIPLSQRISGDAAIGTWPSHKNIDQHISQLRAEWES